MLKSNQITHSSLANAVRMLAVDAIEKANSGHPGMPLGMADIASILFYRHLKHFPSDPDWPDRDRFILSAGHGSMLLYALLYLTGYQSVSMEEIKNFRQFGSATPGHPEYGHTKGVESTTGPLGQGLAMAVGMAIAEKKLSHRFTKNLFNHYTYVIASDGDLMEGVSQEAISLAGHLQLAKLIVFWDNNGISIDGKISLSDSTNQRERFASAGWKTYTLNGHDPSAIDTIIEKAKTSDMPVFIDCKTHIGYGTPTKQDTAGVHGAPLGKEEIAGLRKNLGWESPPFTLDDTIKKAWLEAGKRCETDYQSWQTRYQKSEQKPALDKTLKTELPKNVKQALLEHKKKNIQEPKQEATRKSSGAVLATLAPLLPNLLGGSADLSGSNNTKPPHLQPISAKDFSGQYLHYGIREHAMAAIMNGMALHKGILPYGGSFLVFSDYCRPAIRLSALMQQRVIYVFTHDSIGLGEDGPTHQPVEHLAALRAMPNLYVCRPADSVETTECWEMALQRTHGPTALILTRQSLPLLRTSFEKENLCQQGAYLLKASPTDLEEKIVLLASGSEVSIAAKTQHMLAEKKIGARLVSFPCWEAFEQLDLESKIQVMGKPHLPKIAIEAACGFGWERWTGHLDHFIGMIGFGASAPEKYLYQYFGITAEKLTEKALKILHKTTFVNSYT